MAPAGKPAGDCYTFTNVASIYRDWRVFAASAVAIAMVAGAFFAARGIGGTPMAEASTETALLEQVAIQDSNGDGVPDWEKPLYGIPLDATTTDYLYPGMPDGEAIAKGLVVPIAAPPTAASTTPPSASIASDLAADGITSTPSNNSLTTAFAQNFFALYASAEEQNGGSLTDDQINTLASQALTELETDVSPAPDFKSLSDIKTVASNSENLETFAGSMQGVFASYASNEPQGELYYLQDYLSTGNAADITALQQIAAAYQNSATGLAVLSVPTSAQNADLEIINAMARLGGIISEFAAVQSDPLEAMVALDQYPQAVTALSTGFTDLQTTYAGANVTLTQNMPGAQVVNLMSGVEASSSSATTP